MSAYQHPLLRWQQWSHWQLTRLARVATTGKAWRLAWLLVLLLMLVMAALAWRTGHAHLLRQQRLLARQQQLPPAAAVVAAPSALAQFETQLLARQDIAPLLQDLLERGQALGLLMRQGQYRAQPERVGGFVRYHLNLPAAGPAEQVMRFIDQALQAHPALALASAQLARERIGDARIEARLEWEVMARPDVAQALPPSVVAPVPTPGAVAQVMRVIARAGDELDEAAPWPLFATAKTAPPAISAPAPALSAVATAPAPAPVLPYVLLGRWREGQRRLVFLQDGERTLIVGEGDVLGHDYRVEQVNSNSMLLRQLSSSTQLALELGEALGEDE